MKLTFTLAYYKVPKCQVGRANKLLATKKTPKNAQMGFGIDRKWLLFGIRGYVTLIVKVALIQW